MDPPVSAQKINIITVYRKLIRSVAFKLLQNFVDLYNGKLQGKL